MNIFPDQYKRRTCVVLISLFTVVNAQSLWGSQVSIPDTTVVMNSTFSIPILSTDLTGLEVVSYDCVLSYDPNVLEFEAFTKNNTLSKDMLIVVTETTIGELVIGAAGILPVQGSGVLLFLNFRAKSAPGQATIAFKSFSFSDNVIPAERIPTTKDGTVEVDITNSVDSDETSSRQSLYNFAAYPNPFNNSVIIRYTLPARDFVEMNIFNITGEKIKTLVHEIQSSGSHGTAWNGTSDNNAPVGSGTYFCIIKARHFTKTLKLTYVK